MWRLNSLGTFGFFPNRRIAINHGAVNTNYAPYAGWKESGYGVELSRRAMFEYLKTKHIKVAF